MGYTLAGKGCERTARLPQHGTSWKDLIRGMILQIRILSSHLIGSMYFHTMKSRILLLTKNRAD